MNLVDAYIPIDRRQALHTGLALPEQSTGAALFVDISGFTPLTYALRRHYGPRRGAEELTRQLNLVYTTLITEIERYQGSVIGFSGDAITCWFAEFDEDAAVDPFALQRTITAALAVQRAMHNCQAIQLGQEQPITLSVKTAVAAGQTRRFVVGNPSIQRIDVLAGSTIDRMAATEQMAAEGELWLDAATVALVADRLTMQAWRTDPATSQHFALVDGLHAMANPTPWPTQPALPATAAQPWILPAVAAQLQSAQGRFLAELRPAAALFLKFTGLDYDHDPTAAEKLDQYICWAQAIIDHHEGALIQLTTGDKGSYFYATFGAPIAHDDDIQRAVAVAVRLSTSTQHHPFISQVQIGISYGTMRVGPYGSESRRTYGVLGNETNMAARLMTHAQPGQIVVSQVVADAIAGYYVTEALGLVKLKGRTEPQPLFAVLGEATKQQVFHARHTTPLVGRAAELAILHSHAAQLSQDNGNIVRVVGSAGLGKSHLVAAFVGTLPATVGRLVRGGAQSTAQDTAYFTLRQLMRELLQLEPAGNSPTLTGATEAITIDQLTTTLTVRNPNWTLRLPLLGDLLGLTIPDNTTTATFDARLRQEALVTLTVEIIMHYAQEQPLLLILEDIHWLDEASQGILLALARIVQSRPLLLLLVHRPATRDDETFLHELATLPATHTIDLAELPAADISTLVETRLGAPVTPLATALVQIQGQGNPFFTEELVDALQESGQLILVNERWTLAPSLIDQLRNTGCLTGHVGEETLRADAPLAEIDIGIPTTIQGIILARLDRLPEPVKLTVKVASVIGRVFDQGLLIQAHPRQPDGAELAQELATLLAREFARVEAPVPHPSYIFKHNITQEVVYQTLLTDQRHELHMNVATALEAVQPAPVEALAMHYYNSNLTQPAIQNKARHYLEAAALRAQRDYANETALSYFNRALSLDVRAAWLKAKVEILHILGRRDEEKLALAELANQRDASRGEVGLLWGGYYEALSDYGAARGVVEEALAVYREEGDLRGEVRCLNQLGVILARQADYRAAQKYYKEALGLTEVHDELIEERAALLHGLGIIDRQQGNYAAAKTQLDAALLLYCKNNNRQGEARMLMALGGIAYLQRDYQIAEEYFQQAHAIHQMIGDRAGEGGSMANLGQVARSLGDYSKSAKIIETAMNIFHVLGNRWWIAIGHNELGIIAMMTGNLSNAVEHFNHSLMLSRSIQDMTGEAIALLNLGQIRRDQGDYPNAKKFLSNSKEIANHQGDRELTAQCWSDLAICSLYTNEPQDALNSANHAFMLFNELNVESALTTELCTLAEAHLMQGQQMEAEQYIRQAFQLLEEFEDNGPDYPHRDYLTCYRILMALDHVGIAQNALEKAYFILQQKAMQIGEPKIRMSFLENVPIHRQIIEAAIQHGLHKSASITDFIEHANT